MTLLDAAIGIPWATDAQSGWTRRRLRRVGATASSSGFPPHLQGRQGLEYPFYKVKHLGLADADGTLPASDDTIDSTDVPAACIDNNMVGFIPFAGYEPRFLYWALSQIRFGYFVNPGAVPSVSDKSILEYPLAIPAINKQQSIADFLDRETTQIDTLIEEQQRLIDLLSERRRALIARVATRSVNPLAPVSSGGVMPLGSAFSVTLGKMLDAGRAEVLGPVMRPYVRAANIQDACLDLTDVKEMPFTEAESGAQRPCRRSAGGRRWSRRNSSRGYFRHAGVVLPEDREQGPRHR